MQLFVDNNFRAKIIPFLTARTKQSLRISVLPKLNPPSSYVSIIALLCMLLLCQETKQPTTTKRLQKNREIIGLINIIASIHKTLFNRI